MLSRKPHVEMTDLELLDQYKSSNDIAWAGELYNRYTALVFGVCLKYLKNRDDAKDAVMQLFEKLLSTLIEHEITNFKSWLYVTARNHCLMKLRAEKGKRFEEISPSVMESTAFSHPDNDNSLESDLVKLEKCIEKLASEQKTCVTLFFMQQKCYKDIVTETGYDMLKVKSYIQNGKRNLKICMESNG